MTQDYSSNPWESNHRDGPTGHKIIADVSMTPVPNITTLSLVPTITIPVSIPHKLIEGKYDEENAELYCLCKKPYER